jgi:putative transposase
MRILGLKTLYPHKNTNIPNKKHKKYPYLLNDTVITHANQVWSTDITYIRMKRGFIYLVAIIDWYSRKVLSWRVSNFLDISFCIEVLEEALEKHGTPEIFNTDQGSQFTSHLFTSILESKNIRISMDSK